MSTDTTDGSDHESDLEAIKQVVTVVEDAQNNERPDEFLTLFRADAIWTTGGGKRLYGYEEIAAFTRQALPGGMKDMSVRFELEHVLFIRTDVAAVKLRQIYQTPDGTDVGTPLWVMAKENGRWLLTACQNGRADDDQASPGRPIFGTGT